MGYLRKNFGEGDIYPVLQAFLDVLPVLRGRFQVHLCLLCIWKVLASIISERNRHRRRNWGCLGEFQGAAGQVKLRENSARWWDRSSK